MKQKTKKLSILLGSILLLSTLSILPSVNAAGGSGRTVYGYIYVNGVIADPFQVQKVVLNFSSQEIEADLFENNTYYIVDFSESEGVTGIFYVTISTGTWLADEDITIESGVYNYSLDLHINASNPPVNDPPYEPSNPNPSDGATEVGINADLSWTGGDPNAGDTVTYDVYFDTVNPPTILVSNDQAGTSYDPGTLNYETNYYWKIIATDNNGASTEGPVWSFTTEIYQEPEPGPGPSPSPPPAATNTPPIADADGPYQGAVGEEITLDATGSTDPDGTITLYEWDLDNDGQYNDATGNITTYTWNTPGEYTIKLKVTDDDGATDTDTTTVTIIKQNNPPTNLIITGENSGKTNTTYNYTFTATDPDNDTMTYSITWDDGTTTTAENLTNGTTYTTNHSWNTYGIYTITFTAKDTANATDTTTYTVYIDVHMIDELEGYLIDENSDNIYDLFHNNTTNNNTAVQQQKDGKYLIDDNDDGNWDYIYDPDTDILEKYTEPKEADNTIWYILAIIIIIVILVLFFLLSKHKEEKSKKK